MDLVEAARAKLSSSPSSVTNLHDSLTNNTKKFSPGCTSRQSCSFETKTSGHDLANGWSEKSLQGSPIGQVAPFRYRPLLATVASKEQQVEASTSNNIDRRQLISDWTERCNVSQGDNELCVYPPYYNDRLNIPYVPNFNGSCSSLDFTLDGDQWIDKRKIPASTAKRSGRRPLPVHFVSGKTQKSGRNFTDDIHRAKDQSRNSQIRDFQSIPNAIEPTRKNMVKIEVYPGEFLRLRGADETWHAIKYDFYMPCICICCNLTLFCIQDAIFVLCPTCRIVSPLEGVVLDGYDGGVGLGFTIEELSKWQKEIAFGRETDVSVKSISKHVRG
jgi:hypothetical protein